MTYSEEIKEFVKNIFYRRRYLLENVECYSHPSITGKVEKPSQICLL